VDSQQRRYRAETVDKIREQEVFVKHNKAVIGPLLACMLACAYSNEYNPPEWMFREVVAQIMGQ